MVDIKGQPPVRLAAGPKCSRSQASGKPEHSLEAPRTAVSGSEASSLRLSSVQFLIAQLSVGSVIPFALCSFLLVPCAVEEEDITAAFQAVSALLQLLF